jgi:hypothetical protein
MTRWCGLFAAVVAVCASACQAQTKESVRAVVPLPASPGGDLGGGCSVELPRVVREHASIAKYPAKATPRSAAGNAFGFPLDARKEGIVTGDVPESVRLVVWSEGSLYFGRDLRAMAVDGQGMPMGPAVTVSSGRGNVVGDPLTDVGPGPEGRIVFHESSEQGILELEAAVRCGR